MFAIVEIAGQQFKVEKDQKLYVHRLESKEGENITFGNVLLTDDGKKVNVGTPNVIGAEVRAKVLSHMKGDKVIVFKKKRRKGYQKANGHRQYLSHIQIDEISLDGKPAAKKAEPKVEKESKPVVEKKTEVKKTAPKKAETTKSETKADDLSKIEGVGPKLAGILKEAGFTTYKKLAAAKSEKIAEILIEAGGNAYKKYDPTTWPQQAKLAADEKWDELKKLQEELNGGKAK